MRVGFVFYNIMEPASHEKFNKAFEKVKSVYEAKLAKANS
jgi:hypothetical protein